MNEEMETAEKFMQAVNALKQTLDTNLLEENLDLEIAMRHNLRRKLHMIRSMKELYTHLHGNAARPKFLPSMAFNPFEGSDKTNIHYVFKCFLSIPPWELRKDILVVPVATTLLMIEIAEKLFPGPPVFRHMLLIEEFINRWTLPKLRPEWTDEQLRREVESYYADMSQFEARLKKSYADLALYFGGIETPRRDPVCQRIVETHKNAQTLVTSLCKREPSASFVAQEKALEIWNRYKQNIEVKNRYCRRYHRITYADVFDYCKRQLVELGFKTAKSFELAVKAARKRSSKRKTDLPVS